MDYSVKAIQAQQLYKVQPVSLEENSGRRNSEQQIVQQGVNPFTGKAYNPLYPSVENSPKLGRSLDLLG